MTLRIAFNGQRLAGQRLGHVHVTNAPLQDQRIDKPHPFRLDSFFRLQDVFVRDKSNIAENLNKAMAA